MNDVEFFEKILENFSKKILVEHFLFPPTGAASQDPACFWIEDPSRNRFALNGISVKNPNIFFLKNKILKSSETYAYFFLILAKKKKSKNCMTNFTS